MKKARVLMVTPNLRVSEGELSRMQPPLGLMIFAPMLIKDGHAVKIHDFAKEAYRPWFRAPAGYIAPWMAPVIAKVGFEIDSSVNPSWLVRKKAGPWKDWKAVEKALKDSGIISKPWLTKYSLPTCGPALSIPFLRWNAKRVWKKLGPFVLPEESETTIYWHILDHGRNNGDWKPPLLM